MNTRQLAKESLREPVFDWVAVTVGVRKYLERPSSDKKFFHWATVILLVFAAYFLLTVGEDSGNWVGVILMSVLAGIVFGVTTLRMWNRAPHTLFFEENLRLYDGIKTVNVVSLQVRPHWWYRSEVSLTVKGDSVQRRAFIPRAVQMVGETDEYTCYTVKTSGRDTVQFRQEGTQTSLEKQSVQGFLEALIW